MRAAADLSPIEAATLEQMVELGDSGLWEALSTAERRCVAEPDLERISRPEVLTPSVVDGLQFATGVEGRRATFSRSWRRRVMSSKTWERPAEAASRWYESR